MTAPYMQGLLGPGAFNPTLPPNLLQMLGQPGRPAAQMAQNMAQVQQAGPPTGAAPRPPQPAPAPPPPPAAPPPRTYGATGSAATDTGLLAGGITAMRAAQGGQQGSLGAALGEGLAAGSLAFTARKDAEADAAQQAARQAAYAKRVGALGLPPEIAAGVIGMGEAEGSKMLAQFGIDVTKEMLKPEKLAPGDKLYRKDGSVIAENIKPDEPFDVAKMSPDMRDALMLIGRPILDPEAFAAPLGEDTERVRQILQEAQKAKGTNISVDASQRGPNTANETQWKVGMDALGKEYESVRQIPTRIRLYESILEALDGDFISGGLASQRAKIASVAKTFGLPIDTERLSSTQALLSAFRDALVARLPEMGARPSDRDMAVLMEAMGDVNLEPEAAKQIFRRMLTEAYAQGQDFRNTVERMDQSFQDSGSPYRVIPFYREFKLPTPATHATQAREWGVDGLEP